MFYISAGGNQIYKPLDDLLVLFNPRLTLEMGKAGSLEFDIPPINPYYDRLNQLTTEVTVDMDNEEIFHGRVLSVERSFNNIRHVYCEGDLSYLIDSVQKGEAYNGTTHGLFSKIIANHNARVDANKRFLVGTVNIENRNIILVGQSNNENINVGAIDYKQIAIDSIVDEWNNSFDYIQTCLIDYCGGYLRTRREGAATYIDLLDDFGTSAAQPIELGRNLLDLTEEVSVEDVFTVLIPLGDENLTISSVNGGSDELVDTAAVRRFGRIVRTHVFSNVNNPSTLLENARRFLATSVNVPRTITVRAIDLHLVNKSIPAIKLGDKVQIASYVHDVNDTLTCTKIEYDLEHPDNNNYTFGNPKQTLTQRYREDARLNNDTYGNSPNATSASPSAASAQAAAAAAKEADKKQDEALEDFYKTWIKNSDETGLVELRAQYWKDRETLINDCGILLDASTGNVNIQSLHKVLDEHGHQIAQNTADISIVQERDFERYQSVLDRVENLATVEAQHHTEITQEVGVLGSQIDILASDINEYDDRLTKTVADINTSANDLEARITQKVSYLDTVEGRLNGRMATIEMWANEKESVIALKADKTYVDGELNAIVGNFERLTSGTTAASKLRATEIIAGSLSYWDSATESTVAVPSMNHSHQLIIKEKEGDDGVIEVRLGMAITTIPQVQSFKIADTKYFKDHVAAGNIASLEINYDYDYSNHIYKIIATAKDKDDKIIYETDEGDWNTDTRAYTEGQKDVTVDTVSQYSYSTDGDKSVTIENGYLRYNNGYLVGRVNISLDGNSNTSTCVVSMDCQRVVDDAKPRAIVRRTNLATGSEMPDTWNSSTNTGYIYLRATSNNSGIYVDQNIEVDTNSAIYKAGLEAGQGSSANNVTVNTVSQYSYSSTGDKSVAIENGYLRYNNGYLVGRVNITLTGNNNTATCVVSMDGQRIVDDARPRAIVRRTNLANGSTMPDTWNSSTNTGYIYLRATTNNSGIYVDQNIEVDTNSAIYQAGLTAGQASVTATVQGWTISSSDYGEYSQSISFGSSSLYTVSGTTYGKIKVSLGNGTTDKIIRVGMPASQGGINIDDVVVTRLYSPNRGWTFPDDDDGPHVAVLASVTANNQTKSENVEVIVDDIVNFFSVHGGVLLETTSADVNTYAYEVDTIGYTNALYKVGNYQYLRFQLINGNTPNPDYLSVFRVRVPSTDMAINRVDVESTNANTVGTFNYQASVAASSIYSTSDYQYVRIKLSLSNGTYPIVRVSLPASSGGGASGQITISPLATSASVNPYYNVPLPYYAWINNRHYVQVKATCEGATPRTQYIDINDIVSYAYDLGGGGASSGVTVRSIKALTNKTYDQNMDMYYVKVRVTYSDGSTQDFQAWYD